MGEIDASNGPNKRDQLMMRVFLLGVAAFMLLSILPFPEKPAAADEPEVIRRLRGEMVTVYDAGMRFKSTVQQSTVETLIDIARQNLALARQLIRESS